MEIERGNLTIPVDGGAMPVLLTRPTGAGSWPGIIIVHEIFGLSDYIHDVAGRLAAEGYATLAPDLFWEIGPPPDFSDRASFMRFRGSMDDRRLLASLDAAVAHLTEQPFVTSGRLGIIGFCMGGYYALLETARNGAITACADFYGGPLVLSETSATRPLAPLDAAQEIHVPFLGLFGEADQGIPVEQVRRLEGVLQAAGAPTEIHTYPGAEHAFHNNTGQRYHATAAEDAWQRTLQFFATYLQQ